VRHKFKLIYMAIDRALRNKSVYSIVLILQFLSNSWRNPIMTQNVQRLKYLYVKKKMNIREMKTEWRSPCYFVMHEQDVLLQYFQSDCHKGLDRWESIYREEEEEHEKYEYMMQITVLFRKPSAKYCAPAFPILLYWRSNMVSACMQKRW
jgi:hypothetical protein